MTAPPGYRMFHAMAILFVASIIIANTIAVKVISIFGFVLPAGILCFPIVYIWGDLITEVYGYAKARSVIWWGFISLALMSFFYYLAVLMPSAPFWEGQEAFESLFGFIPRIAFASLIAYLAGSFLNAMVMSKLKVKTEGKYLWMRAIGSTIVGEGVDSLIFNLTAFLGVFAFSDVLFIAFSGFVLKTAYEIVALPLTYYLVRKLKKIEGEEKYDEDVSYNPFQSIFW